MLDRFYQTWRERSVQNGAGEGGVGRNWMEENGVAEKA